jgi:hypothetical protein
MREYPLTKGKVAIVDDDFYEYLVANRIRFHFMDQGDGRGYAEHDLPGRGHIRMHRMVYAFHGIEIPDNMEPDHINRNRLDNRFENLRLLTRSHNLLNRERDYGNSNGYRGVRERRDYPFSKPRYRAIVCFNGKQYFGGTYDA